MEHADGLGDAREPPASSAALASAGATNVNVDASTRVKLYAPLPSSHPGAPPSPSASGPASAGTPAAWEPPGGLAPAVPLGV